jgi:hypothetical protein
LLSALCGIDASAAALSVAGRVSSGALLQAANRKSTPKNKIRIILITP